MNKEKDVAEAPEAPEWKDSFTMIKREGVILRISSNSGSQDGTFSKETGEVMVEANLLKGLPAILEPKKIPEAEKEALAKMEKDQRPAPTYYLYVATGSPRTILAPLTTDGGEELREVKDAEKGDSKEIEFLSKKLQDVKEASTQATTEAKENADKKLQELKDKYGVEVDELKAVIKGLNTKKVSLVKLIAEFFKPKK